MEKKQTALQQLVDWLEDVGAPIGIIKKAKCYLNLEREQIEEAFKAALPLDDNPDYMADKYYNSKYGK